MRRLWTALGIVLLTAADQLLKWWARTALDGGRILYWEHFFALRLVQNSGAAFSMFNSHTLLLSVLTGVLIAAGLVVLFSGKIRSAVPHTALTMILAGGVGNWVDRIWFGAVTDFIEPLFMQFAVFNFADILITCGAGLLVGWIIADSVRARREKKAAS